MFDKTKGKVVAVSIALAMVAAVLPVGGKIEAQAAEKTKVIETAVNFDQTAQSGDGKSVYLNSLVSKDDVVFGKSYALNMKIYVPAAFMENGSIWVKPNISFYTGADMQTEAAWAVAPEGYYYDLQTEEVAKYQDFYMIDAKMPINFCEIDGKEADFPSGEGTIVVSAFVVGEGMDYKGSIYFDDAALVVDDKVTASADFENGKVGYCKYSVNCADQESAPKVVSFTGNALEVAKKAVSVKVGKKVTVKATATPTAKITYKSSNKKVATVTSKGVVKGIKKGTATITVQANGKTVKVKVTVKK